MRNHPPSVPLSMPPFDRDTFDSRLVHREALLVAALFALLARTWLVQAFRIPTGSMEPLVSPGERVIGGETVLARWTA